jgi:aryl-alcohol dehydrogenase-like predicted oxidoreductase
VSCTIPGARTVTQSRENAAAADLPRIAPETMTAIRRIYDDRLRPVVHHNW